MRTLNPKVTLQNLEGQEWLVSIEHDFGGLERVVLTVRVPKGDRALSRIQRDAFDRAQLLLSELASTTESSNATPAPRRPAH